ncbi:MAG: DUF4142 domain-containing protein [Myxococcales bacterium]|nr:MAG: DUF4142 domain-containing protein [Myxococcales bacterium]
MSHLSHRTVFTLAALSALASACAGDQREPETPAGEAEQAPVMKTTPSPGEESAPAPNGQPAGLPQAEPQSMQGNSQNNVVAAPAVQPAQAKLSEDQIARVAELVNTAEVDQGKLAQSKAQSPRVKAFATKMVNHHSQAKAEQAKLVKQLNLTAAESPEAAALKSDGAQTLSTLKTTPAADFDRAYIDSQVTGHQKVLTTIDEQLLPSAKSERVVSALKLGREAVAAHLAEAKEIQDELSKTTGK